MEIILWDVCHVCHFKGGCFSCGDMCWLLFLSFLRVYFQFQWSSVSTETLPMDFRGGLHRPPRIYQDPPSTLFEDIKWAAQSLITLITYWEWMGEGIPREDGICTLCDWQEIESEEHFNFRCPIGGRYHWLFGDGYGSLPHSGFSRVHIWLIWKHYSSYMLACGHLFHLLSLAPLPALVPSDTG